MKSKLAQHRLTDRDGDVLNMYHLDDGLYCTVQKDGGAGTSTAGPFAPEQLRAALDEVAPAGSYTRTDEEAWDFNTGASSVFPSPAKGMRYQRERDEARNMAALWKETAHKLHRAAKDAEKERDEALADLAEYVQAQALRTQPRPLTPDAITDEMVNRAAHCMAMGQMPSTYSGDPDGTAGKFYDDAREVLCAALTEPPARPEWEEEGAKALTVAVWGMEIPNEAGEAGDKLAFSLARHGYKVVPVTEGQP